MLHKVWYPIHKLLEKFESESSKTVVCIVPTIFKGSVPKLTFTFIYLSKNHLRSSPYHRQLSLTVVEQIL